MPPLSRCSESFRPYVKPKRSLIDRFHDWLCSRHSIEIHIGKRWMSVQLGIQGGRNL